MIKAWSYSRWHVYNECPAKAKFMFIDKLKDPGNIYMDRGNYIHKLSEDYVRGATKVLPQELIGYSRQYKDMKKLGAKAELELAFTEAWEVVDWFDPAAWLRVKVDILETHGVEATIVDVKTGSMYDHHPMQLSLYALAGFLKFPEVKKIDVAMWYVDKPYLECYNTFRRNQLGLLKETWTKRLAPMLKDKKFTPTPGDYCRRCFFRKSNDGPCKY